VPFSTALLAAYYQSWMAVVEYWFNIFLLGAVNTAAVEYAARTGLFSAAKREILLPAIRRRALIAQSLYAIATALSIFDTRISIAAIVLIQLNYALARGSSSFTVYSVSRPPDQFLFTSQVLAEAARGGLACPCH